MKINVSASADDVIKSLQGQMVQYQKQLSEQVFRALTLIEAQVKQNIRSGSGLQVRTGSLLNSITKDIITNRQGYIVGEVASEGVIYAAIHEFGGIIKPVTKQFLTVPAPDNRNADGTVKESVADLRASKNSFIRNGTIFKDLGGGNIQAMFFLKKSVTIPARPYMAPALAATQDKIMADFGLFLQAAFKSE